MVLLVVLFDLAMDRLGGPAADVAARSPPVNTFCAILLFFTPCNTSMPGPCTPLPASHTLSWNNGLILDETETEKF